MDEDLQLDEDMRFQERGWAFQRVGWAFLGIIVAASLAGLLGPGPVSRSQVEQRMLRVDYQRFAHRDAPTPIEITYRHKQGDSSVVLEFAPGCLAGSELEGVRPDPKSAMAREAEGMSFEFDLAPGSEWTKLSFQLRPRKAGLRHCEVRTDGELAFLEFAQFVYP